MSNQTPLSWTPCEPITPLRAVGRYIAISPIDLAIDPPLLWEALGGNADINQHLRWFGLDTLERGKPWAEWLEGLQRPEGAGTNVLRSPAGEVVGMASYMATVAEHGVTEIGSVAHGKAMMRSPAATEAHFLLAQHAFETYGYRRYEWKCNADNWPSRRAAERMGFNYEGTFRQHRVARGHNRDTAWFSMIDRDWPGCKAAFEAWLDPSNFDEEGKQKNKLSDLRSA
ncbi:MAG: GNAT family protein [Planctomycetota bacterium]